MLNHEYKLWYRQPAEAWGGGLPIGNGRMGAVVYGQTHVERIDLDEESVWSGHKADHNKHDAHEYLEQIRTHLFNREYVQAKQLTEKHFIGNEGPYGTHLTAGTLFIETGHSDVTDYRRELDLTTGCVQVQYCHDGIRYQRRTWATHVDNVLVMDYLSEQGGGAHFKN